MPAPAPGLYADSVFEIGSITKVFTAILLADMADRGEVKLDDPVAMYLPADVRIPERSGRKITLLDLSTQSSGLPRMPDNLRPSNPLNPVGCGNSTCVK
jgi:serine-type D-Ala-D-Ala carboxypeptidase/endopeptidase